MKPQAIVYLGFGLQLVCCLGIATATLQRQANVSALTNAKTKALNTVAREYQGNKCWKYSPGYALKIGDPIPTEGNTRSKIPTSCVINQDRDQIIEVGYLNNELQVIHVFNKKSVSAKISEFKKNDK